jgi:beta-galactosidase
MRRREFIGAAAAGVVALTAPIKPWELWAAESTGVARWRDAFNHDWLFCRQEHGGGALGSFDRNSVIGSEVEPKFREATRLGYDDANWKSISLPHTWNAFDTSDDIPGYFRGIGWYRKHFLLGEGQRGKRIFLEFEGVGQVCEVWLNEKQVGIHKGGYTSFEFDITEYLNFGGNENVLVVKVNNVYDPNLAPTVKTDVTFYGGIYRNVWLRIANPIYCSTLYWLTPQVSDSQAEIEIHATVANTGDQPAALDLLFEVLDPDGIVAAHTTASVASSPRTASEEICQTVRISKPQLWHPDTPRLYRIRASIVERASNRIVDSMQIPLGLRWYRFDPNLGFFLNGKRLQLRGTTWHQSYPGMGSALPDSRHFADMKIIRDMGCNFFRTSHYPHAPAVMDACDQFGLLVLEELFIGDEVETGTEYVTNQTKQAEEMISRDRNHPSVILWGLAGEVEQPDKSPGMIVGILNRYRALDKSRPVTMHDPRVEKIKAELDVVGLYKTFEEDDRDHKDFPSRKYLIEEYSAAGVARGRYGMGPESEDLACVRHEEFISLVNQRPWIAGSVLWHQFDYDGDEYDPVIPHVVTFGMADFWRIPKDVFYFYKSQWSGEPMVHICGHWTWPDAIGAKRLVRVYTNLEDVQLLLNGRSLGTNKEASFPGLAHPPHIWEVPFEPGVLQAVARTGRQTVTDTRKTAGPAVRIDLKSDVQRVRSGDDNSYAYVTASVVDDAGTVVPSAFHPISFTSYGPGELLPQVWAGHENGFTWNAIAGMCAIAFRSTDRVGRSVISAYSPGLQLGRVEIAVATPGKRDEMEFRGGADIYK